MTHYERPHFSGPTLCPGYGRGPAGGAGSLGHFSRPRRRVRGHGGQHDRRVQANHRVPQRGRPYPHVQPQDSEAFGPLSHGGGPPLPPPAGRETKRYRSIKVEYQNEAFQTRWKTFTGFPAQIIQHEIDHCDGILI